jgi:hypothetical protein
MEASNTCGSVSSIAATLTLDATAAPDAPGGVTVFRAIGPNPNHGNATLAFSLARGAAVRYQVHDVRGRLVRSVDVGRLPAGSHQARWDTRDGDGQRVAAGVYLVSLAVR